MFARHGQEPACGSGVYRSDRKLVIVMVNVAVLGYGTVGSGVAEVIWKNQDKVDKSAGVPVRIKYVLDLREFPGDPVEKVLVHDFDVILNDPEVDIVVEVMGGLEPAHTFVKKALLAGKSACTSNKAMVAKFGPELMDIAKEKNVNFMFEASCGGGIPIIRAINESLTADVIDEVTGILNGTTNYMLYRMDLEGAGFDEVLKEAQDKGYAEKDPSADVDGFDASRKIAILSSLAYGGFIDFEDIPTEGIRAITPEDSMYAKLMNRSVKLLGTSSLKDGKCWALVAPFMISHKSPLYAVNGVFNAVFVHGNMLGDAMFYGSGAGKLPTASAVVGDVIEEAKNIGRYIPNNWSNEPITLMDPKDVEMRYFVRLTGMTEEKAETVFGKADEFIVLPELPDEFAMITPKMSLREYEERASQISGSIISMLRVKD